MTRAEGVALTAGGQTVFAGRRAMESEARRRDDFLAAVAHEPRNPSAPIGNAVAMMRVGAARPEVVARATDIIDRQSGALSRIVDDLLDASRAGRGKLRVSLARLELAVLARAAEDARPALEGAGLALDVRAPSGPVWVRGDAVRLQQVVSNLLTNAGKFTDRGGGVTVAVAASGGLAVLTVADSGVGIAAADLAHMFRPFSQSHETIGRSRGGLGLGLALVRSIVELHGGTMQAESAGVGRGATFTARIPLDTVYPPER